MLNVTVSTIADWCQSGLLDGIQSASHGPWWIRLTPEVIAPSQVHASFLDPPFGLMTAMEPREGPNPFKQSSTPLQRGAV